MNFQRKQTQNSIKIHEKLESEDVQRIRKMFKGFGFGRCSKDSEDVQRIRKMFKGFGRCSKDSERFSKDLERCSKDSESVQRIRNLFKGFGIRSKGSEDAQRIRKKD